MNNMIIEMDVTEAFAEYETLCAIGDCISKQILMESYFQESDNEPTTDNIPAPNVTTFQKFKNWVSRIITLIKRNTSKFSRVIQKWLTRGVMGELYKEEKQGKKIKVQKALLDCIKYIVEDDDWIKRISRAMNLEFTDISDYRKWLDPVVRYHSIGNYVSLKETLDREIKKSNPYLNKLKALKDEPDNTTLVEVKFDDFSKSIKALQQKSDNMSDSIKVVNEIIADGKKGVEIDKIIDKGKGLTYHKDKNFDHYVASMTSLMKWLLTQSNLILYIGMLIPLIGTVSEDTSANNQQVKK